VFVGNGSDEALALCTRAFVEDEGSIGYFDPSYSLYPVLAAIRAVRALAVPLAEDFGWPAEHIPGGSLFFLCNPNAPTSLLFPKDRVRRFCATYPGVVLIDEAYVDFARTDCLDLARELPNVMVLRTLSKAYSLAGIRLGYTVGPADLTGALFQIKDSYNVDRVTQAVAAAALADPAHMQANVARIQATRTRLTAALARRGFGVSPSDTNFVWARPRRGGAVQVYEKLKALGILIRYFPGPRTGDHVRITVGTDEEVDRLLAALPEEAGA
jgi:histidinol-phosphate aminotransferase